MCLILCIVNQVMKVENIKHNEQITQENSLIWWE